MKKALWLVNQHEEEEKAKNKYEKCRYRGNKNRKKDKK